MFHDHAGEAVTSWKRNEHYLLVAPKEGQFVCPVDQMPAGSQHFNGRIAPLMMFGDPASFKIVIDGSLKGTTMMYNPQEFCVVQTEGVPEDNSTNLEFQLFACKFPSKSQDPDVNCEARMIKVQSSTLIISIVFLLITLIIYLIEPSLQKQYLFNMITRFLIVNMTATFIIIVYVQQSKDPDTLYLNLHTGTDGKSKNYSKILSVSSRFSFQGCKAAGYFKQYFFLVNSNIFDKLEFETFCRHYFSGCMYRSSAYTRNFLRCFVRDRT